MKIGYLSFSVILFFMFLLLGHGILAGNPLLHGQSRNTIVSPYKPGIKITSPEANATVPAGPLTVNGISSDTSQTDCKVYIDWNDLKPMQNVTAIGTNGTDDYSSWKFTYDQNYHTISEGVNELTSKIICTTNPSGNTTKFYSINVTGITGNSSSTTPSESAALFNQSNNTLNGYHSINYQGILPQYNVDTIREDEDSSKKDKHSDDKYYPEQEEKEDSNPVDDPTPSADEIDNEETDYESMPHSTTEETENIKSFENIYPKAIISYDDANENVNDDGSKERSASSKSKDVKSNFESNNDNKKDKDKNTSKIEKIKKKSKSIFGKTPLLDSSQLEMSIKSSIKKRLDKVFHNLLN